MNERDVIFRERLVAVLADLNGGAANDPELRRVVGRFASRMAREAGVRDWADLKARADGPTCDSALQLFQDQSAAAHKAGNSIDVRAFEVLGLSLIARGQQQADLLPGVSFLDSFIAKWEQVARKRPPIIPTRASH